MGIRDFFKRFTQKKLTDGTKDAMKNFKRNLRKAEKGDSLAKSELLDAFFALTPDKQVEQWKRVQKEFEGNYDTISESMRGTESNNLLGKSMINNQVIKLIPMLEYLKDDEARHNFVSKLSPDLQQSILNNVKCQATYDSQYGVVNCFLKEMRFNENKDYVYNSMGLRKEMKDYLQVLSEKGEYTKVTQFIYLLTQRKNDLPSQCITDLVEANPNLKTPRDVCYFINSSFKREDGTYLPNVNIQQIQKLCAGKILQSHEDSKDHMIKEGDRESILMEMSEVNRSLGGKPYLDFANIMMKSGKNNMPTMPLLRNDDLFAYVESSKDTDVVKPEDKRVTLKEIDSLQRPGFSIKSLSPENRKKLIDILVQDNIAQNSKGVDDRVEKYFQIKSDSPEYNQLVSDLAQFNCQEGKTPVFTKIDQVQTNFEHEYNTESKFLIAVAKTELKLLNRQDPSASIYNDKLNQIERVEALVESQKKFDAQQQDGMQQE